MKNIRFKAFVILALVMNSFSAYGRGVPDVRTVEEPDSVTVTDSVGRVVAVPREVERIAALYSFAGYAASILGKGPNLVGVPGGLQRDVLLRRIVPEIAEAAVPRGGGSINIEELLRIEPDLVIIRSDTAADKKELEKLDRSGIPYIIVEFKTVREQQEAIAIIGRAIGREKEAEAYNAYYRKTLERVNRVVDQIPEAEKIRVYYSENQPTRTTHRESISADWARHAGIINVSADKELTLINNDYYAGLEQILYWDPEVIIANETTAVTYILANPQWSGIEAVRNSRVYQLPQGISRWGHPGSIETPLAILWTAKTVYPRLFEDVDLEEELSRFYADFFNYPLSESQVGQVLSGRGLRERK